MEDWGFVNVKVNVNESGVAGPGQVGADGSPSLDEASENSAGPYRSLKIRYSIGPSRLGTGHPYMVIQ